MKKIFFAGFLIVLSLKNYAQDSRWQLRAELYKPINPFSFANATVNGFHFPSNFGFAVGAERDWKQKKRVRIYQTATVGFYNEVYFERVVTLESNFGMSFKIFKGLNAGFEAGTGYHRAKSSNLVSVYQNDKWVSKVDNSVVTNRVAPALALNIGYDFSEHFSGNLPISVSISSGANLLLPYIPEVNQPLGIMRNNKITLKYRL